MLPEDAERVRSTRTSARHPPGLDAFWHRTLSAAAEHPPELSAVRVEAGLSAVEVYDVTFRGFGGEAVRGWLRLPAGTSGRLPCVVEYQGYGGGRGLAHTQLLWSVAGFAHLVMDTRGQGSVWSTGATPDAHDAARGEAPGVLTRGLTSPDTYYYRRLVTDAVRAVEAVAQHPRVDPERVAAHGISQGGGLAIAAASLSSRVGLVMSDVPFLSDFRRAAALTESDPYLELVRYLRTHRDLTESAFETLDHFDVSVLGTRATAPALFSVGLQDTVCPPSTVFAAYNAYGGPKQMVEWPYDDHEGGAEHQQVLQLRWLREQWGL